jgi:hypothetical protein
MAVGDGALAVAELRALRQATPETFAGPQSHYWHYWLGLAHMLAFDWPAAATELRAFVVREPAGWRAGWAYLHLGRAYEQAGRIDEASLAYRGCLAVQGVERPARRLAFDLMSRLAASVPISYGQAPTRQAGEGR